MTTFRQRIGLSLTKLLFGHEFAGRVQLAISARVSDADSGWTRYGHDPHDVDPAELQQLYTDSLTAWRKNPMAWRIIQITADYTIGEKITISSPDAKMQAFIDAFWSHPQNRINNRLEAMSDELARSGDLFPVLMRNPADGMSYIRFLTQDQIDDIETATNDWETETIIYQKPEDGSLEGKRWYTPHHGRAKQSKAIILHYSVNRPMGAKFGVGDLTTAVPWLLRYSRLLEDRVRMHWAIRAFLWIVTVPTHKVKDKAAQYSSPPEAGSVIVKDESEEWDAKSPVIRGSDAAPDMKAIRGMIDASSGYPPHWRGEATDVNLATATAMQEPAEKHLKRRQNYFVFILEDLIYNAYQRAHQLYPATWPLLTETNYNELFTAVTPDISKTDNSQFAAAALSLTQAYSNFTHTEERSIKLTRRMLSILFKFIGEPIEDKELDIIIDELIANPPAEAITEPEPEPEPEPAVSSNGVNGRVS